MSQKVQKKQLEGIKQEIKDIQLYINGEFVNAASNKTFNNLNPLTNEVINQVAEGDLADIEKATFAAKSAFKGPWGKMKVSERLIYIKKIADVIDAHIHEIAPLESYDTGLTISQTKNMGKRAANNFRFYADTVSSRLVGEAYQVDDEFINYTINKPIGVAGLITPWNAPFMLETWKIAPALATGNTAVLKPAEWSPITANKMAEIIDEAELPEGVFNVVHVFEETTGAFLVAHEGVKLS